MALCTTRTICIRSSTKCVPFMTSLFYHNHPAKEDNADALDEFTSNLVHKKSVKWEKRKSILQNRLKHTAMVEPELVKSSRDSIQHLEAEAVNDLFRQAIDYDDYLAIIDLTKQCIEYNKIPSLVVLLSSLAVCSRFGDKDTIVRISQLCEKIRPELVEENCNFDHYIAEAIWVKGDIKQSLNIFKRVYKENAFLRRRIRSSLRHLILNCVTNHSEATLVCLTQFSEMLVNEHRDYFTLGCLWQACILSEWFADQQLALNLLEKYRHLSYVITNKIPIVVRASLRQHNTEVVYRLNEVLLKLEMHSEVCQVILSLIDYWIQQGDFRQCKEIVMWSIDNGIDLPMVYQSKMLVKLLATDIKNIEEKVKSGTVPKLTSEYKF